MNHLIPPLLVVVALDGMLFPLKTDSPPKVWKVEDINNGLPYRWEKGAVHALAWEVIEEKGKEHSSLQTQVLVLKRFDEPPEKRRLRWVLAHLYHHPKDDKRPWHKEMLHIPPLRPGEKMPKLSDAQIFGYQFYDDLPTDAEVETFLGDVRWKPRLGPGKAFTLSGGEVVSIDYTTTVASGGVNRDLWKKVLSRDVPPWLFPELKKETGDQKR